MTSRVSFYKVMIQDLRHRIWMIALSCLGSFLAMPVFYLLISRDWMDRIEYMKMEINYSLWDIREYRVDCMKLFYQNYLPITAGIVLGVGAIIVGIFGFRHVFSKKMVDQYHSIPIKRRDLFMTNYLNGFLIWFVPMLIGGVSCAVLSGFFVGNFVDWMVFVIKPLGLTIVNLVLAFLLIYHVAIVAVMMSGNILNTLVNGTIINFVIILLYCMVEVFSNIYFSTYYSFFEESVLNVLWTSPICSAVLQLYMYAMDEMLVFPVIMNVLMILVMFAAGYLLYLRRPSELAEQGMKIKTTQVVFKAGTTILAGMAGWAIFYLLTENFAWQIFGTVLASVLCYGILDIIFCMDFKAFFAHKLQLCGTVIVSVLVGCLFFFDWIGYDAYMPEKEDIAEMGIYVQGFGITNTNQAYGEIFTIKNRVDRMSYKDKDVTYALLNELSGRDSQFPHNGSSRMAYVRVEEKNGKTYYRQYRVWESDEELILPVLRDESYIRTNVMFPQVFIDDVTIDAESYGMVEMESFNNQWYTEDEKFIKELFTAYNADVLENPDIYIYQNEEILFYFYYRGGSEYVYIRPDFYESMEQVKNVLRNYGYEDILSAYVTIDEIESISMDAHVDKYNDQTLEMVFGLEDENEQASAELTTTAVSYKEQVTAEYYEGYFYSAKITERQDMEALLEVISFNAPNYTTMFRKDYCNAEVRINLKNGKTYHVHIKKGRLPERFLDYFEKTSY